MPLAYHKFATNARPRPYPLPRNDPTDFAFTLRVGYLRRPGVACYIQGGKPTGTIP